MDLLIGLDAGTSAVKGVLVSAGGDRLASARRAIRLLRPSVGRAEIEPEEHYRAVCDLLRERASGPGVWSWSEARPRARSGPASWRRSAVWSWRC